MLHKAIARQYYTMLIPTMLSNANAKQEKIMKLPNSKKIWGNGYFCYKNYDKILEAALTPAQSKKVCF